MVIGAHTVVNIDLLLILVLELVMKKTIKLAELLVDYLFWIRGELRKERNIFIIYTLSMILDDN